MVDAVLKNLPEAWSGVVVMDWSDGFWDKMKIKHNNNLVEKLMKSKEPDNKSLKL